MPRLVVSDQTRVVEPLPGETIGTRHAEPAYGTGGHERLRHPRPPVPVAHVRHGPGRRDRLGRVVRAPDDRRVRVPGHARAGGLGRDRPQGSHRRLLRTETAALEVRRPSECANKSC